jgi:hypothetical protein
MSDETEMTPFETCKTCASCRYMEETTMEIKKEVSYKYACIYYPRIPRAVNKQVMDLSAPTWCPLGAIEKGVKNYSRR